MVFLLLAVFCLLHLGRAQRYDQKLLNNVGDFVLKNLKIYNPSSLALKNKTRSFGHDATVIEINSGSVSDFKSIRRAGDILLEFKDGGGVLVNFRFKFDQLKLRFEEYRLRVLGKLTSTGAVEAAVRENLVEVEVDMGQKSLCFLTVNRLEIVTLEGIDLTFYKPDRQEVSQWKGKVMNPLVKKFKGAIRDKLQKALRKNLPKIIKPNKYLCGDDEI